MPCPPGYSCLQGKCLDKCSDIKCGPRSVCEEGTCVCPPGYSGNPNDLNNGCHLQGHCSKDLDCEAQQICFQVGKGSRKCVDGCSKLQCGPNALCVTQNHVSSCICIDGYYGNPSNLADGCRPERTVLPHTCSDDTECVQGSFCTFTETGRKECINPCNSVVCGSHEKCQADVLKHATCVCQDGYEWNPVLSSCEKPSVPDCISDNDCELAAACRPDALGVLKCASVCKAFTCPINSQCIALNHQGQCECLPGFTGNPNNRSGCLTTHTDKCSTDTQCPEDQTCRSSADGTLTCQLVCNFVSCGPNALCIVNNHVARCECPPGLYAGDAYDKSKGCQTVPCVYNIDCPPTQLCNRLTHTCYDVCDENSCGLNAVCIADDHRATCQCPPGFKANPLPDIECVSSEVCTADYCHPSAVCVVGASSEPICQCPPTHVGDPYTTGCQPEGSCTTSKDCPVQSICQNHKCINPCENVCGANTICEIINGEPICKCAHRFVPSSRGPQEGCVRASGSCSSHADCDGDFCLDGRCSGKSHY